ncbi:unnamed protein product [Leptosia nina]|uniref:Uncharacterized protein n=1 Tax=Leptosia nina TaxID=320188 RepID=A0AAV1JFE7_9NEOP
MAKTFVIHACLIFLTFCPSKGTDRWKKVIHNYKRDFNPQKKIDLHKFEIYDDYYDKLEDYSYSDYSEDVYKEINVKLKTKIETTEGQHLNRKNDIFNATLQKARQHSKTLVEQKSNTDLNKNVILKIPSTEKWPKFEDILLQIGRKYDWKNDRWIKVKKKIDAKLKNVNKSEFNEKHRFIYRIVRLNRPKSKRNIVLAVTAVR